MPGLSNEDIKKLLAVKPKKTSGGVKSNKGIDTSVRTFETWFKLGHRLFDENTGEPRGCDNPNCIDPRPSAASKKQIVVEIAPNQFCCRFCFLDGWSQDNSNSDQLKLA